MSLLRTAWNFLWLVGRVVTGPRPGFDEDHLVPVCRIWPKTAWKLARSMDDWWIRR